MSTAKFDTLSNLAGTLTIPVDTVAQGTARAWVNFNGTGTVAIRAAFNVSSITDNGTGNYTVNMTTAMPDTSFAISVSAPTASQRFAAELSTARTVSAVSVGMVDATNGTPNLDTAWYSVAIFR